MPTVIQISEATSIALHSMVLIARSGGANVTVKEIVSATGFSHAHSSKVLQQLVRAGLLHSTRGPKGGFLLSRPGAGITLLAIWEAMEGPLGIDTCIVSRDPEECPFDSCILGELPRRLSEQFRGYLGSRTLASVVEDIAGKTRPRGEVGG
jgi:Rrf2 family protein